MHIVDLRSARAVAEGRYRVRIPAIVDRYPASKPRRRRFRRRRQMPRAA